MYINTHIGEVLVSSYYTRIELTYTKEYSGWSGRYQWFTTSLTPMKAIKVAQALLSNSKKETYIKGDYPYEDLEINEFGIKIGEYYVSLSQHLTNVEKRKLAGNTISLEWGEIARNYQTQDTKNSNSASLGRYRKR